MALNWKNILVGAALVATTTVITAQVTSRQDEPDMNEMMEYWMQLAQPGEQHAEMAKAEGKWHQAMTHWMMPGAEPQKSTATATMKPILGGRFMFEKLNGKMNMGGQEMDFEGLGIFGYDNLKEKYVYVWADSMGTMIMMAEGDKEADGSIVYFSEMPDPMSGGSMKIKSISRELEDDKHVFEMHTQMPDGSWFQNMEIVATRK